MGKYNKLYKLLKCDIDVPINDLDAWTKYPDYRWVYNKIMLCKYQNIDHAPMPIKPPKYPVILKPIINLYGMGLNIKKINNDKDFSDSWYSNDFWMEFLEGVHLSWDIIILKGDIVFHTCFIGHNDNNVIGKFDHWESTERNIIPIIKKLVKEHFKNYSGCLNVETINNKIIECHLRMGDIDIFPTLDILKGIIATYKNQEYDWNIDYTKVYFYPVWTSRKDAIEYEYVKKYIGPMLIKNKYIHDFNIDSCTLSSPTDKYRRLMWFTCSYKNYADKLRLSIYNHLKKAC